MQRTNDTEVAMFVIHAYIVLTGLASVGFWVLACTGRDRPVTRHAASVPGPLRKAA